MIGRLLPAAFALLFGCATAGKTTADNGAPGPQKAVRCKHYAATGTRIMKKICSNDAPIQNLLNIPREEFRNMQMKNIRPTRF